MDQNYPSDISALKVQLLNEIAAIEMSTDTLYLDHPTSNVVNFTDASRDAIFWNWEFDHGNLVDFTYSSNRQNERM